MQSEAASQRPSATDQRNATRRQFLFAREQVNAHARRVDQRPDHGRRRADHDDHFQPRSA